MGRLNFVWFVINCTQLHCVYRGGLGGGALIYELLKSAHRSEICSEPQNFFWFVINCTPLHCVYIENPGGALTYELLKKKKNQPSTAKVALNCNFCPGL